MLNRTPQRRRARTVLLLVGLGAVVAYAVLGAVTDGREERRGAPTAAPGSDVEWRSDGVYINGKKRLDTEQPAASAPASAAPEPERDEPTRSAPESSSSVAKDIGQKIVSRMSGLNPGPDLLRRVREGRVGGVILFGDNIRSLSQVRRATSDLQQAAAAGGNPPLLIAVDQEGGTVKRFGGLPPRSSATDMAASGTAGDEGAQTGGALGDLGVNVDLAPVVDVPTSGQSFLGTRAFGRSAAAVARSACSFAQGLRSAGVLPTLKHFPGLGAAGANTDFDRVTITASSAVIRAGYSPYRRCASEGLVMISNAVYPALTGPQPAVLASATYDRELQRIGFDGVTISDDLQAAAVDPIPELAVKASAAGLDLLLYARTEGASALAYTQLRRALEARRLAAADIRASAQRIRALKQGLNP